MVGSCAELGSWDAAAAAQLEWSEGDCWEGLLALPPGEHTCKLVVVRQDGSVVWEEGADRALAIPEGAAVATITCRFGDTAATEVEAELPPAAATVPDVAPAPAVDAPAAAAEAQAQAQQEERNDAQQAEQEEGQEEQQEVAAQQAEQAQPAQQEQQEEEQGEQAQQAPQQELPDPVQARQQPAAAQTAAQTAAAQVAELQRHKQQLAQQIDSLAQAVADRWVQQGLEGVSGRQADRQAGWLAGKTGWQDWLAGS